MAKTAIEIDASEIRAFSARLRQAAAGDFKKELALFVEWIGMEFLRVVQDEIMRRKVIDTRLLLESFHKGNSENLWEVSDGGLTIEVGTLLEYASYVNDGHWQNEKGEETRFVPGRWSGDRFIYEKGAKTGMVLKQKWVEGAHYWEAAIRLLEKIIPGLLDRKLQEWLDRYFGDFN